MEPEISQESAPLVIANEADVPLQVDAGLDPGHAEKAAESPETSMADAIKKELEDKAKSEEFFDKKKDEPKAEAKPEEKPKDEPKPDAKLDEIYRIPEGMTGQHRAAFKRLSDHAIELNDKVSTIETQAREAVETLQEYHQIMQDTQASPEQMTAMFDYIEMVNTGRLDLALHVLETERNALAKQLGKPVPGVDLLDGFDDLKSEVQNLQMTPERAAEIARYRRQQQDAERNQQSQQSQQAQQQAFEQERHQAMADVESWMKDIRSKDLDFAAKDQMLAPKLQEILTDLAPKHWLRQIKLYYDALQVQPQRPTREPQPLRPQSGGGGKAAPRNMFEALSSGLGYDKAG